MPPFRFRLLPRYRDCDAMGHVNNAVYLTYLEEARAALFREVHGHRRLPTWPFLLARAEVDYKRPVTFGDEVVIDLTLEGWGRSSFRFAYEGRVVGDDGGDAVAFTAKTVQVHLDPDTGRPGPVPDEFRKRVEAALGSA